MQNFGEWWVIENLYQTEYGIAYVISNEFCKAPITIYESHLKTLGFILEQLDPNIDIPSWLDFEPARSKYVGTIKKYIKIKGR